MRITEYFYKDPNWKTVKVTDKQLVQLKYEIENKIKHDTFGNRVRIRDNFYEAKGSYYFLNTCNTWVNQIFKKCGLKAKLFILTSGSLTKLY